MLKATNSESERFTYFSTLIGLMIILHTAILQIPPYGRMSFFSYFFAIHWDIWDFASDRACAGVFDSNSFLFTALDRVGCGVFTFSTQRALAARGRLGAIQFLRVYLFVQLSGAWSGRADFCVGGANSCALSGAQFGGARTRRGSDGRRIGRNVCVVRPV